uniref:Large ribosomal subunit protein bL32c n=2 Tax=Cyperaceae TaxID=4609 RepID=A0A6H0EXW6_9POAL|nr:ribosomal protein L32 [Hypolytrum nemorum]ANP26069.1 ribosomal protein L32 [Hypolytrum nemorum]QIB72675.1 ribosomal protein L32 [Cyperus glomeratus]QIB72766.1 ribosomal protein L32 [Cyperus difformis]QIT06860.1 ribosomal protein L32 [Cyperus fuscus]
MAVPKKRTSMSKKRIRRNIWRKKGYLTAVKVSSLAKSVYIGNSKSFIKEQPNNKIFGFGFFVQ